MYVRERLLIPLKIYKTVFTSKSCPGNMYREIATVYTLSSNRKLFSRICYDSYFFFLPSCISNKAPVVNLPLPLLFELSNWMFKKKLSGRERAYNGDLVIDLIHSFPCALRPLLPKCSLENRVEKHRRSKNRYRENVGGRNDCPHPRVGLWTRFVLCLSSRIIPDDTPRHRRRTIKYPFPLLLLRLA